MKIYICLTKLWIFRFSRIFLNVEPYMDRTIHIFSYVHVARSRGAFAGVAARATGGGAKGEGGGRTNFDFLRNLCFIFTYCPTLMSQRLIRNVKTNIKKL